MRRAAKRAPVHLCAAAPRGAILLSRLSRPVHCFDTAATGQIRSDDGLATGGRVITSHGR